MTARLEMNESDLGGLDDKFAASSPPELIAWALDLFGSDRIVLSSSLGAEDQVLTDMVSKIDRRIKILTIDTGRLHQETYHLMMETMRRYGIRYDFLVPDAKELSEMLGVNGPNLFYESIDKRKLCCEIRKIRPLKRHLASFDAWICGLRRVQTSARMDLRKIEWDANFGLVKLNPLADWTEADVWAYIRTNDVPYNKLHDKGYPSIGCAPCTRAVAAGEPARAGRWWWEHCGKKECGLHFADGRLVRKAEHPTSNIQHSKLNGHKKESISVQISGAPV